MTDSEATEQFETDRAQLGVVHLTLRDGLSGAAASVRLEAGQRLVVGSAPENGLYLEARRLSRRHCEVVHAGHVVTLQDLDSTNGVFVSGTRLSRCELCDGDSVELADCVLSIASQAGDGRARARAPMLPGMLGRSPVMLELSYRARKLAPLGLPVLIRGESGTGKELVARALHTLSGRRGAFVAINGAAISRELAESELFGHKKGAFTGAHNDRLGAFREADQGTLFIDEVGALAIEVQAKLLRAVEEQEVRPLGGHGSVGVDVRVVAATCEPLEQLRATGGFRADLYERLSAGFLALPPLRERREDVPALTAALLQTLGFSDAVVSSGAFSELSRYPFRGNVRELRNLLAHAALLREGGGRIEREHVRGALAERGNLREELNEPRALLTLQECGGNITRASRMLGCPRTTLRDFVRRARHRALPPTPQPGPIGQDG